MKQGKWAGRALSAALLGASLGACDFIGGATGGNPNIVNQPSIDQLFVTTQLNAFVINEGQIARATTVWLQQIAGTDRQFALLDQYNFTESELDDEFSALYSNAGLIGIRRGKALADAASCAACKGLFQIHEAFTIGMGASIFGDIPYSEAVDSTIRTPKLDKQEAVYAALQQQLDQAIAGLSTAPTGGAAAFYSQMSAADLNFGGNRAAWTRVANTLKARLYMHWVEAQDAGGAAGAAAQIACGGNCLQKAIAAAQNGIMDPSGNWRGIHSESASEFNLFYQFAVVDRAGYISAGKFGVDLLQQRKDPRLRIYYATTTVAKRDTIFGSAPGESNGGASGLNTSAGVASAGYDQPIVSCAENQFILAEAHQRLGNMAAAQAALRAGVACQEKLFGVKDIPVDASLTGTNLLREIITQKYIALFLNPEVYNDYKRTCLPAVRTFNGRPIPRRFLYGGSERQTNPNIPTPDKQPVANTNDPKGC